MLMQISETDSEGLMCTVCYLRGGKLNPSNFHHCPCKAVFITAIKHSSCLFPFYHVYKLNVVVKYQLLQVIFCVKYQASKNRTMTFRYQGLQWICLHAGFNVLFTICWISGFTRIILLLFPPPPLYFLFTCFQYITFLLENPLFLGLFLTLPQGLQARYKSLYTSHQNFSGCLFIFFF